MIESIPGFGQVVDRFVKTELHPEEFQNPREEQRLAYKGIIRSFMCAISGVDKAPHSLEYVLDEVRTSMMLRAMVHLLHRKMQETTGDICLIEAGVGTGFFPAIATNVSDRIVVKGFDTDSDAISASQQVIKKLGDISRVSLEQRDLILRPYAEQVDAVIAEHLSAGGLMEKATLVRSIPSANPADVMPYSVQPHILFGARQISPSAGRCKEVDFFPGISEFTDREVSYVSGVPIILADQSASDFFRVEGKTSFQPGLTQVIMAQDVNWQDPSSDPEGRYRQTTREHLRSYLNGELCDESILPPTYIQAERDQNRILCFKNSNDDTVTTRFSLQYPTGLSYYPVGSVHFESDFNDLVLDSLDLCNPRYSE